MLAIILILSAYVVLVVIPPTLLAILKDGSPFKKDWWTW